MSENVVTPTEIVVACDDIIQVADCVAVWKALRTINARGLHFAGATEREITSEAEIPSMRTLKSLCRLNDCTESQNCQLGTAHALIAHYKAKTGVLPHFTVKIVPTPEYTVTVQT